MTEETSDVDVEAGGDADKAADAKEIADDEEVADVEQVGDGEQVAGAEEKVADAEKGTKELEDDDVETATVDSEATSEWSDTSTVQLEEDSVSLLYMYSVKVKSSTESKLLNHVHIKF